VTKKNLNILLVAVGVVAVGTTLILINRRNKKMGKTAFRRRAVKHALKEYEKFNSGKLKESSSEAYPLIKKYWDSIGWSESKWSPTGTAWSAAFISYIMKKANAGNDFKYSSSHSKYIVEAIKNRKENNSNKFKGYLLDEKKLEVGDLVCYSRQGGVGYDTTGGYKSHCDIVVNIDKNSADVIGGNVGDSVTKKKVPLTNDGKVKEGGSRFVVIKTK
jgi:hypothetical protein